MAISRIATPGQPAPRQHGPVKDILEFLIYCRITGDANQDVHYRTIWATSADFLFASYFERVIQESIPHIIPACFSRAFSAHKPG